MKTNIEMMPRRSIAYIRNTGSYGMANKLAMEQLKSWAKANDLLDDNAVIFGIAQDDPEKTLPENCRYDTCIVIDDAIEIAAPLQKEVLDGGKYFIFEIDHTAQSIANTWMNLFDNLTLNGCSFDESRPIIERYRMKLVNQHHCEICAPIK